MELLLGTLQLRPYVFVFVAAFLVAGITDLGWRRTLLFTGWVWPVAWLSEFASTRVGIPFGLYYYTEATRGREVYVSNVPLMDSLSFTFLAYAAFCLARAMLGGRSVSRTTLAVSAGGLMMLLDVVIDPVAFRGDRWFLGDLFAYAESGWYFGVPLTNFFGWWLVGAIAVGGYLGSVRGRGQEPRVWAGVALYYGVLVFNLAVTAWIAEWVLLAVGIALHTAVALTLWTSLRWTGGPAPLRG